jgi:hypothetical protein
VAAAHQRRVAEHHLHSERVVKARSIARRRAPVRSQPDINIAASTRDVIFLLLVFAVAMGFTHQFGYMQRLGSEMELGEQPIPHLAVDALLVISQNWWIYGSAVLLAAGTLVFWKVARRRGWVTMPESESTVITLVAFTAILSALSYGEGRGQAAHFYQTAFAGHDDHAHEIFVPAQAITPEQCYDNRLAAAQSPPSVGTTRERWYLTAESSSRYHVIRQTIVVGNEANPPRVEPIVIDAGMLKCFQQLQPSAPSPVLATQTPANQMIPTPLPRAGTVAKASSMDKQSPQE